MIKKFTSEIIMDNRRAKIKDLIERNVFSIPGAAEYFYVSESAITSDLKSMDQDRDRDQNRDLDLDPEKYMDRSDNEQKEIEKLKEELQGIKENDYEALYKRGLYCYPKYEKTIVSERDVIKSNRVKFGEAVDYYRNNYINKIHVCEFIADKFNKETSGVDKEETVVDKDELKDYIKEKGLLRYEQRIPGYGVYKGGKINKKYFVYAKWGEKTGDIILLLKDSTQKSVADLLGIPVAYIRHIIWGFGYELKKEQQKDKRLHGYRFDKRRELIGKLYFDNSRIFSQEIIAALLDTNRMTVYNDLKAYMEAHQIVRQEHERDKHKVLKGKICTSRVSEATKHYLDELKQREEIWGMLQDYYPDQFKDRLSSYFNKIAKEG